MIKFSPAIWLLIFAACLYGINAPVMKMAQKHGATPAGMTFAYGIGCIILSLILRGNQEFFPSWKAFYWAIPMGFICGIAFILIGKSFGLGATVAMVTLILAIHPIPASLISMTTMGEFRQHDLLKLSIGFFFALLSVYFIATSTKT